MIKRNVETVLGEADRKNVTVLKADYRRAASAAFKEKFSLVFLDPPYRMNDCYEDALNRLIEADALANSAIIVMEKAKDALIRVPDSMEVYDERVYRDTVVAFARFKEMNS